MRVQGGSTSLILPTVTIEANPDPNDLEFMDNQINEHNVEQTGYRDFRWLAALIRDDAQNIVAGITGFTWGLSCRIQSLWVHPGLHGQGVGRALMHAAEHEAIVQGCHVVRVLCHWVRRSYCRVLMPINTLTFHIEIVRKVQPFAFGV